MEGICEWVKNIICYFIFLTVLTSLLPSGKYEKYVRLFAGMVLIMIVAGPFLSGIRMEDRIAGYFEEFSFQNEAADFKKEIYGMEEKRLERLMEQYEEAVAVDVRQMAEEAGLDIIDVQIYIEGTQSREDFGKVKRIQMTAAGKAGEYQEQSGIFRRKAAGYYQLEENYVEIQFQNRQG